LPCWVVGLSEFWRSAAATSGVWR